MLSTFVALISVEGTIYEYYHYDAGLPPELVSLIEERPTLKLVRDDDKWRIEHYTTAHTVEIVPMFRVGVRLPREPLVQPMAFAIDAHQIVIQQIIDRGVEGVIYTGTLDNNPMIFKMYTRNRRTLRSLPPEIREYVPRKYLLFEDKIKRYVIAMQPLINTTFSEKLLQQSLQFLQIMQQLGEVHGDISPGNVMMDEAGNVKFIDFARTPANKGTAFYSKNRTDAQALAIVLLGFKYAEWTRGYIQNLFTQVNARALPKDETIIDKLRGQLELPLHRFTLGALFRNYKLGVENEIPEAEFVEWLKTTLPQDDQSRLLISMAYS